MVRAGAADFAGTLRKHPILTHRHGPACPSPAGRHSLCSVDMGPDPRSGEEPCHLPGGGALVACKTAVVLAMSVLLPLAGCVSLSRMRLRWRCNWGQFAACAPLVGSLPLACHLALAASDPGYLNRRIRHAVEGACAVGGPDRVAIQDQGPLRCAAAYLIRSTCTRTTWGRAVSGLPDLCQSQPSHASREGWLPG